MPFNIDKNNLTHGLNAPDVCIIVDYQFSKQLINRLH